MPAWFITCPALRAQTQCVSIPYGGMRGVPGQLAGEQTGDSMGRPWKPVRPFILQAVGRRRLGLAFALLSTLLASVSAPGTNHNGWLSLTNLPPRKQKETQGLLATTLLPTEREALRAAVPPSFTQQGGLPSHWPPWNLGLSICSPQRAVMDDWSTNRRDFPHSGWSPASTRML